MFTELEAINTKAVFLINTPYRLPGEIPRIKKLSQQRCSRPSRAHLVNHSTWDLLHEGCYYKSMNILFQYLTHSNYKLQVVVGFHATDYRYSIMEVTVDNDN